MSLTSNISAFTASKVKSRDSFEKLRPCRYRYSFCYLAQGSWNFWYLIEVFGTWRNKQGGHQNFVWMCLQTDWTIFLSFFYRFLCSSVHINNLRESVYKVSHFCEDDICKVLVIFSIWSSTASNGPCIPPPRLISPWCGIFFTKIARTVSQCYQIILHQKCRKKGTTLQTIFQRKRY